MKRRICSMVGASLLFLSSILSLFGAATASSRETVYFTAVNDTVLDLRDETMPFLASGDIYVPYTMFDPNAMGISLGVFATYSNNTAMIYSRSYGALMFDLVEDSATTSTGQTFSQTAIRRNSVIFVPATVVCNQFHLTCTLLLEQDYGFIVRVKNSAAQISDRDFVPTAKENILEPRYNAYMGITSGNDAETLPSYSPQPVPSEILSIPSFGPAVSPSPAPVPSGSASPIPSPVPSDEPSSPSPSPSPPEEESPEPEPLPEGGNVYLAFRCDQGGDTTALADTLAQHGIYGLFFFHPDELIQRDNELRLLAAAGHKIGLLLDGDTLAQRTLQAREGNELLAHILRSGSALALSQGDEALPTGWISWRTSVDGVGLDLDDLVEQVVRPEDCFLLLDDSSLCIQHMPQLLSDLSSAGCTFCLALETVLAN